MKLSKLFSFVALLAIFSFFTSCNETTTPDEPKEKPNPPTELKATSYSATEVLLKWTPSTSESNALFKDYVLEVTSTGGGGLIPTKYILKTENPYVLGGLVEGVEYTFVLKARYTNGEESTTGAMVKWSPATRFFKTINGEPIRLMGSKSAGGSGLNFYNSTEDGPEILTVAFKSQWDVGIYTGPNNDKLDFGSPKYINVGTGTTKPTLISSIAYFADSLNDKDATDNVNLANAKHVYEEAAIDLTDPFFNSPKKGVIIVCKTADNHWAKVFIKRGPDGKFIQGSGNEIYIEVELSYQMEPNVPYARPVK